MDHVEVAEQPNPPPTRPVERRAQSAASAPSQGSSPSPSFVYALGRVEPRFPNVAAEKEFAQVTGRTDTAGHTDRQAMQSVLADRANRYLARELCWVFTIEGLETYILSPRDPLDFESLIDTVRPNPSPGDMDLVIGVRGPIAPPEVCNGMMVPVVSFDLVYTFDRDELVGAIPRPEKLSKDKEDKFQATAGELFDRIMMMADNAGATDEHRAVNYLAVRYPAIYARTMEAHDVESSLSGVEVRPSRLSGTRKILDVIFAYTHRRTDVIDKYFVRVDVTDKYPFLVTKLASYYERS